MVRIELERVEGDYGFKATDGMQHTMQLDTAATNGGLDSGFRPMQTLLSALGGCSDIDIVSILKKQRQAIDSFKIIIEGEREAGKEPSLWKQVKVRFELGGNIEKDKAWKACSLSIDKYCSVAETLRRAGAEVSWELILFNNH
jgi:putative redox protein